MSVRAEALAAETLRDWLLLQLPARVATVNATRKAFLRATSAGPYEIPASAILQVRRGASSAAFTSVALTAGTVQTSALVTEINTGLGATVASADSEDRLVLTSTLAPTVDAASVVEVKGTAAEVFGWGETSKQVFSALVAPAFNDVQDGWPDAFNFGSRGTVVVVLGERRARPLNDNPRCNEHLVSIDVNVFRTEPLGHRNREHIQAALQCVREVLLTTEGRQFGRAGVNDIVFSWPKQARVSGMPFSTGTKEKPGPLFDAAAFVLDVKVFERPS